MDHFKIRHIYLFILLFLVCCYKALAQANPDNQLKYIDILPPSPAVAKLAEISRPDVGMSSGTAQFHLPLTSLDLGSFKIPIALNYSSNGVRVDGISSRVGIDFQIEAGGAITRTVHGNGPDEQSVYLNLPNVNEADPRLYSYLRKVSSYSQWAPGGYDNEPDIFAYSFVGRSGKFIMDSARNILQLPKTNSKIEKDFSGTAWTFKITDDQGNQFFFGGSGYTETTTKYQSCSHPALTQEIATAWFLRKIVLYNGDVVTFGYNQAIYRYDLGVSETIYYQLVAQSQPKSSPDCAVCPVNQNSICVSYNDVKSYYLSSIQTTRGSKIDFGYTSRNDCGDMLLTTISKYFNSNQVEGYSLQYYSYQATSFAPPSSVPISDRTNITYRYFLNGVTKLTNTGSVNLYQFSYNNPNQLPPRLSFAQDDWGYFNGKVNSTMIPPPWRYDEMIKYPQATANRDIDTVLCKVGLMTKIQYVTGGYDSISYEVNKYNEGRTIYPTTPSTISGDVIGSGFSTKVSTSLGTIVIGYDQYIDIDLRCTNISPTDGSGTNADFHQNGLITLTNGSGTQVISFGATTGDQTSGTGAPGTVGETHQVLFIPAGTYSIQLSATGQISEAEVDLTYVPGSPTFITKDWPVGGVRVSQIKSKSYDGSLIGKRNFSYRYYGSTTSSGILNYHIDYQKTLEYTKKCYDLSPGWSAPIYNERLCSYGCRFSSSLTNLFSSNGTSIGYGAVQESFDNNSGNGLIEHAYYIIPDRPGTLLMGNFASGPSPNNASIFYSGKEFQTSIYQKNGASFSLVQKTTNYYSSTNSSYQSLMGCIVNQLYPSSGTTLDGYIDPTEYDMYDATKYEVISPWNTLDSVSTVTYASSGEQLTTYTKYFYDTDTKLVSHVRSMDSYGALEETYNYYSGMGLNVPGSTQGSIYTSMIGQNLISQLVYQKKLTNGNTVDAHRVLVNSTSPYWPQEIKEVNTSTNAEESLFTITKYDTYGNILERQKRDGITHSFLWNHAGNYPVAEVIGAASGSADATSFEGDSFDGWSFTQANITNSSSITGAQSYNISPSASIGWNAQGTLTNFVVSFWAKNGMGLQVNGTNPQSGKIRNGWTYYEIQISSATTVTISGTSGQIDELRLYPKGAQMTTFTYDPEIGMTSSCDANNVVSYFEYDGFKRLLRVRDDQNNILKTYRYHFYQPAR